MSAVAPANVRRMLRLPAVSERIQLSKSTIKRLIDRREFPLPVCLSPATRAWFEDEIDNWLRQREQARG